MKLLICSSDGFSSYNLILEMNRLWQSFSHNMKSFLQCLLKFNLMIVPIKQMTILMVGFLLPVV